MKWLSVSLEKRHMFSAAIPAYSGSKRFAAKWISFEMLERIIGIPCARRLLDRGYGSVWKSFLSTLSRTER